MMDIDDRIDAMQRPRRLLMEQACAAVIALGYDPLNCLIEYRMGNNSIHETNVEVDRLIVAGTACFEVEVVRTPIVDLKFTVTTTPRFLAWPPPAPQVRASSAAGTT